MKKYRTLYVHPSWAEQEVEKRINFVASFGWQVKTAVGHFVIFEKDA